MGGGRGREGGGGGGDGGEPPEDDSPETEADIQFEFLLMLEILNKKGRMNRNILMQELRDEMRKQKGHHVFFTTGTSLAFLEKHNYVKSVNDSEVIITIKGTQGLEKRKLKKFYTDEDE